MAKSRRRDPEPTGPDLTIPLPKDGVGSEQYWADEIEQAEKRRKKYIPTWRKNLDRYRGETPSLTGIAAKEVISVNADFYNTEQKKAQLFYQSPDVQVTPRQMGVDQAAILAQHVLNEYLGPDEVDAKRLMDDVLFDVLCPSGFGATKIGYEDRKADVQIPQMDAQNQPMLDPLTGQPVMQTVPKAIWQRYYWEHIAPEKLLMPASFTQSRYELAPWLGFEFAQDADDAAKKGVEKDSLSEASDDSLVPSQDKEFARTGPKGVEIWYKASLYDPEVKNPELYRRLVMVAQTRKRSKAIIHEDSPYQRFDPQTGAFLQGMRGNPVHICTTRAVTDTAYPPSDCSISRPQVDELSLGRSQMVQQRRRNLPLRWFDRNRIGKQDIDKIVNGEIQGLIPLDGPGGEMIGQIAPAQFPRENFTFADYIQQDMDKSWALSANQQGVTENTARTATELSLVDKATDTRMAAERERVLSFYVKGVEKLFSLLQLFADNEQIVQIVGQDGQKELQVWDKTKIQGRFAFAVKPDSSVRIDAAEERDFYLRSYNLLANDPNINRAELVKMLAAKLNLDPAKVMQQQPEPPPEKPKMSFTFRGEDLRDPLVLSLLEQAGYKLDPQLILKATQAALTGDVPAPNMAKRNPQQQPHGGTAETTRPINQHDANLTGERAGRPAMA